MTLANQRSKQLRRGRGAIRVESGVARGPDANFGLVQATSATHGVCLSNIGRVDYSKTPNGERSFRDYPVALENEVVLRAEDGLVMELRKADTKDRGVWRVFSKLHLLDFCVGSRVITGDNTDGYISEYFGESAGKGAGGTHLQAAGGGQEIGSGMEVCFRLA